MSLPHLFRTVLPRNDSNIKISDAEYEGWLDKLIVDLLTDKTIGESFISHFNIYDLYLELCRSESVASIERHIQRYYLLSKRNNELSVRVLH